MPEAASLPPVPLLFKWKNVYDVTAQRIADTREMVAKKIAKVKNVFGLQKKKVCALAKLLRHKLVMVKPSKSGHRLLQPLQKKQEFPGFAI